jgi:hypothetical protein
MRYTMTLRYFLTSFVILLATLSGPAAATDAAIERWRAFRQVFPNHIQTLAISSPDKTGATVLIIAEPPPDTLPRLGYLPILRAIFSAHLKRVSLEQREIGLHGWIGDLVLTLGDYDGAPGAVNLRDDIALLANRLWGTSYKSDPLPIDPAGAASPGPPNVAIRQTELRDWLIGGKVLLSPTGTPWGRPKALNQLINEHQDGAFLSAPERGLAVLVVNRHRPFEDYRAEFRKFAIDSDILVGAVAFGADYLVFAGRERNVSVTVLPPLRFETAHILVTSHEEELAQSYERTNVFAGRLEVEPFAGYDWAPIYLSPALIDTEFGSELNLTDQMLKSWSMAGRVIYRNFFWPTPTRLPFGGKPILYQVQKKEPRIHETLFNWNTTGAFSRVGYDSTAGIPRADVYALLYSGSLPVIYTAESQPEFNAVFSPFEAEGYAYYRELRNPLLARVTSYQVMFQATRVQPLPTNTAARQVNRSPSPLLRELVKAKLREVSETLAEFDDEKIATVCLVQDPRDPEECFATAKQRVLIARVLKFGSDRLRERIVDTILNPRATVPANQSQREQASEILGAISVGKLVAIPTDVEPVMAEDAARRFLDSVRDGGLIDADDRLMAFVLSTKDDQEDNETYISTPRVVISSAGSIGVGGHNLSGVTPQVVIDALVPSGSAKIETDASGISTLHLNRSDIDKAGPAARLFAKKSANGESPLPLQQELRAVLAQVEPPRSMKDALVIERPDTSVRGTVGPAPNGAEARIGSGWKPAVANAARLRSVLAISKDLDLTVVVTKINDLFSIICVYCASGHEVVALSHVALRESVVDAIAHAPKGMEQRVFFEGFAPNEVKAFRQSLAFDGGGMEPPIGPPPGAAATGPDPGGRWWRAEGGGGGGDGTNGDGTTGGHAGGGGKQSNLLIFTAERSRSSAHEVEVHMAEGDAPRSMEKWALVRREMQRSLDWSEARVDPIPDPNGAAASGQTMSVQLIIPPKPGSQELRGRFQVAFDRDTQPNDQLAVVGAANGEIRDLSFARTTIFAGVTRLIDRLKAIPHVADVRFFLRIGVGDATLSELPRATAAEPG